MAINAKTVESSGGGDFVRQAPMEEGTYPARVVQAIYFGLQAQNPYKGEDKPPKDEVMYTYEFLDEFCLDEDGEEDESLPRWVSERFPVNNISQDKAKSTKRILALDPDDDLDGEFLQVVNTPCMVTISCTPDKGNKGDANDKFYNNVTNVSPMREKDVKKAGELVNPMVVFDIDNPVKSVFEGFPEWIQDKLKANLNYKGSELEAMLEGKTTTTADDSDDDDDTPEDDAPKKAKKKGKKKKAEPDVAEGEDIPW